MAVKRSGQTKKKSKSKASSKPKAAGKKTANKPAKNKPAQKKPAKRAATQPASAPAASDQRVAEIQRLIDVMVKAGAVEVEMEDAHGGRLRVRLKEDQPTILTSTAAVAAPVVPVAQALQLAPSGSAAPDAAAPPIPDLPGEEFVSPMVGSFYRGPSPEAENFCQVGDTVSEDTTICIIEAMKVMNEIKAELNGRIVAILVENGEPVEFGQPLFRIQRG